PYRALPQMRLLTYQMPEELVSHECKTRRGVRRNTLKPRIPCPEQISQQVGSSVGAIKTEILRHLRGAADAL
ncbi:MAG: hypothetical protein ACRDF4_07370, partial [Rhabdochlamydiaceae bacterium]